MSKINEFGLNIDISAMYQDLILEFAIAVENVAQLLLSNMKVRSRIPVVQSSLKKEIIFNGYEQIEAIVGSDHWQAFLDNYGVGSLMADASENPYLQEYKSNYDFWNRFRNSSNAIMGREAGTYIVPDWESGDGYTSRISTGSFAGINLENLYWGNNYNLTVTPQKPTFFLENSMRFIEKVFEETLYEVYDNFPFYKYIKGGVG